MSLVVSMFQKDTVADFLSVNAAGTCIVQDMHTVQQHHSHDIIQNLETKSKHFSFG